MGAVGFTQRWWIPALLLSLIAGCTWFRSKFSIRCTGPVGLHADSESCLKTAKYVIPTGEVVSVESEGYSKDCMYYKIRRNSGESGYIFVGEPFEVSKNGKTVFTSTGKP